MTAKLIYNKTVPETQWCKQSKIFYSLKITASKIIVSKNSVKYLY